jgi:Protein of unknown function (DUF2516)
MSNLILGPINGFFLLVFVVIIAVKVWALIDALTRPAPLFEAAGKKSKTFWIVILAIAVVVNGFFLGLAALVAAIVYLVDVRPAIKELRGGSGSRGWRT